MSNIFLIFVTLLWSLIKFAILKTQANHGAV
jgi:hypothetical protein